MIRLPSSGEVYAGHPVTTTPNLPSPCLKCRRKDKEKIKSMVCQTCQARSDLALVFAGDADALSRYMKFDYPDLGRRIKAERKYLKCTRNMTADGYYHEAYYDAFSLIVKNLYGVEFRTVKEILGFMVDKFSVRMHIARELKVTRSIIDHMCKKFELPTHKKSTKTL